MQRFHVYELRSATGRAAYPYVLNVQGELVDDLRTRVVVPLAPAAGFKGKAISRLMPLLDFGGESWVMLTAQLGAIRLRDMGKDVADLSGERFTIIAAIDVLRSGN